MRLRTCTDLSPADWLVRSEVEWDRLITLGPGGFAATARLRFVPDPTYPGQDEADNDMGEDHLSDWTQAAIALRLLAGTSGMDPAEEIFLCLWDGYGDLPADLLAAPRVPLPHRDFVLLTGSVDDIDAWHPVPGGHGPGWAPAFAWPADHSWCFTSDVDPHWAGIGASQAATDTLLAEPRIDVVQVREGDVVPRYA